MPIQIKKGNIFEAETQTIVNTVNCKGVMGKGLALEFKKRYPKMYEEYKKECEEEKLTIGTLHLYKGDPDRWILNFPTKDHWRFKSRLEYIEDGLKYFCSKYKEWGIKSIAFPQLGCQQGGLNWSDVKPLMERYLKDLPDIEIFIYFYKPKRKKEKEKGKKKTRTIQNDKQQKLTQYPSMELDNPN